MAVHEMAPRRSPGRRETFVEAARWVRVGVVAAGLATALTVAVNIGDGPSTAGGSAAGASAPGGLAAAVPADGATLGTAPTQVLLTFTGAVSAESHVGVSTAAGAPVPSGTSRATGTTVATPVSLVGRGNYLVAYHVVLVGGRELSGSVRFAVSGPGGPAFAAPAAGTPVRAAGHGHGGRDPLNIAILGANLALIAGAGVLALRGIRRNRR